jgi:hypothetical protein
MQLSLLILDSWSIIHIIFSGAAQLLGSSFQLFYFYHTFSGKQLALSHNSENFNVWHSFASMQDKLCGKHN